MNNLVDAFFASQLKAWGLARQNYKALQEVLLKEVKIGEHSVFLQFNPGRIISSSAKVDKKSLAERPCFLCKENLPTEQEGISLSDTFTLLVNPFPILKKHFTVVNTQHTPQRLLPYVADFLSIAHQLSVDYTVFYNGPKCGASAPDHMHFQAGLSAQFPIWNILPNVKLEQLYVNEELSVQAFDTYVKGVLVESSQLETLTHVIKEIVTIFKALQPQEDEPMLNVLAKYEEGWKVVLFPREKHRPTQYFEQGEKQLLLSPASVDFGGLLAVPRQADFERIDATMLEDVFEQLCINSELFEQLKLKIKKL